MIKKSDLFAIPTKAQSKLTQEVAYCCVYLAYHDQIIRVVHGNLLKQQNQK